MKTYIISLLTATERRVFQKQQLEKIGLTNYEFFNAINSNDINAETYQKHYNDWQRPLRKAEMGCYFSHQALWQKIIDNNQPALILEDDAILSKHTAKIIKALADRTAIDLVDFEVVGKKKYLAKTGSALIKDYQLFYIHLNSAGAGAYVLYPSGAKKLLSDAAKHGIAPTDSHIPNCHTLNAFQVEPALSVQPVFCEYYHLKNKYRNLAGSATSKEEIPKRNLIFRLKRIVAQVKLGLYKLSLLNKSEKRVIQLNHQDFL